MIEEDQEEERKGSESEDSAGVMDEDSDEEDSNMIPDEKPDGATAIGDTTANEMDLLDQISQLEAEEKNLGEEVTQKEALLDKIKQ